MQQAPVAVEAAFQHKLKFIHIPIQKGITNSNPFFPSPFLNALTFAGTLIIQFSKFE